MDGGDSTDGRERTVSRRRFVEAAGAAGISAGLAGCTSTHPLAIGGGDERPDMTTVTLASDSTAADNAQTIREAMWESGLSRDIYVEIQAGARQTGARQSQYTRWLSAGLENPDMLMMDSGWALTFIARDQLLNLEEALPTPRVQQVKDDYFEASVTTAVNADDDLYAVPLFPDFPTMQYRKDLLREVGYGESDFNTWATESMHWKEFAKITKQAKEQTDTRYGFTFQADIYEGLSCCDFNEFMTSWGGAYFGNPDKYLFGPIGERPVTVSEKPVEQSIKMIRTFIYGSDAPNTFDDWEGQISPQAVLQWTEEPSRRPFADGNAVMHRNWPYSIVNSGAEDAFGKDLGVMPIPYAVSPEEAKYPRTGGPVAALGGWHMTVNPSSPNIDTCIQVLEAMMTESFKLKLLESTGWLPPEPDMLEGDAVKDVPIIGRYMDTFRVAGQNAIPRPVTAVWPLESTKIAQNVHSAYSGENSPEAAMDDLQSTLETVEEFNRGGTVEG
jgi:ABC-type glycerol-3-phosphate transport system substrate-binding protein